MSENLRTQAGQIFYAYLLKKRCRLCQVYPIHVEFHRVCSFLYDCRILQRLMQRHISALTDDLPMHRGRHFHDAHRDVRQRQE